MLVKIFIKMTYYKIINNNCNLQKKIAHDPFKFKMLISNNFNLQNKLNNSVKHRLQFDCDINNTTTNFFVYRSLN